MGGLGGAGGAGIGGGSGGGGGGAGLGGAIFVRQGGTLTITDFSINATNNVIGGLGGQGQFLTSSQAGVGGQAQGAALYLDAGVSALLGATTGTSTISTSIAGVGGISKIGAGTLILNGSNSYAGGTTISAGTLQGSTSSLTGAIADNAALVFDQASAGTFSGAISGSGSVTKESGGTLILTGNNSYTGGTTVSGGTLSISSDANLGTGGTVALGTGTTLAFTAGGIYAHAIVVTGDPTFDIAPGQSVTQSVVIADGASVGTVVKTDSGTLVFTAAMTYSGGTTVSGGTLQLGTGGSLAATGALRVNSGTFDLNGNRQMIGSLSGTGGAVTLGNGTLTVNQSTSTSYAGGIGGTGGLIKIGTGTLILNGLNTYTGLTTVSAGTLEVGDINTPTASLASAVTVGSAGTLAGHGTVAGNVSNSAGGIVAPGGTIGTLTVGGNYSQDSRSTLQIEVSPNAASQLRVSGSASVNGALVLVYAPGIYSAAAYDILHAGSVNGTFATVSGNTPAGFLQSLLYTSTDVDLALTPSTVAPTNDTIFTSLGTTALLGGQQANATVLGYLSELHNGNAPTAAVHTALASTAPTQLGQGGTPGEIAQDFTGLLSELPDAMAQMGGWFRATGNFASLNGSASVPGFTTQSGGFLAGIDRPVSEATTLGIAAGYSHTNLSASDGESGTLDTPRLMLYASYAPEPWVFDGVVGYAYDRIGATRPIAAVGQTATSTNDGQEVGGAAQASYRVDLAGMTIMPTAGLQYIHLFEAGFTESGAPGFDLMVANRNSDSLRPFIGASATHPFRIHNDVLLVPEADLTYSHELMNAAPPSVAQVGGGSFSVNGLTPARDQLTVGGELTATLSERLALFAAYHASLPVGNLFGQTVEAGLRCRF